MGACCESPADSEGPTETKPSKRGEGPKPGGLKPENPRTNPGEENLKLEAKTDSFKGQKPVSPKVSPKTFVPPLNLTRKVLHAAKIPIKIGNWAVRN